MYPVTKTKEPPKIKPALTTCDKPIAKSIPDPLPKSCFRMLIIGRPGSGKSALSAAFLLKRGPYYRVFDRIWAIVPPNSRDSYKKDPFKNHDRVFDELTPEILERVIEESKQLASEGKHGLLYIDDQAYALKNKRIEQLLRLIYFNSRHMHLSSIIISQTLRQVGVNIRKTASHLLTYEPANRLESKVIAEEFLYLDPASAAALFEQAFQKRFDHLMISTGERRAYINWDEVELPRSF